MSKSSEGTTTDGTEAAAGDPDKTYLEDHKRLVDAARHGVLVVQNGSVAYVNQIGEEMLGGSIALPIPLKEIVVKEDQDKVQMAIEQRLGGGMARALQVTLYRTDKKPVPVTMEVLLGFHGDKPAAQLLIHDPTSARDLIQERTRAKMAEEINQILRQEIQEHRRTQGQLDHAERFARSLIDSSLDLIIAVNEQGEITEFNPAAEIKFGYEASEVLGRTSRMLYTDQEEYKRIQTELSEHGIFAGEIRNVTSEGVEFTTFLTASRLFNKEGELIGSMGISRDVTQARKDQEALRASEERYRDLFENATDLIQSVGVDGKIHYVNNAWKRTLGYTEKETVDMSFWSIVHPNELELCKKALQAVVDGVAKQDLQTVFLAKDGSEVQVRGNVNARWVDGKVVSTRSIFHDITPVNEAQRAARVHLAKLKALFESKDHMFWTVDQRLALTSFNTGYAHMIERLHGAPPEVNTDLNKPRAKFASEEYHLFWQKKYEVAFSGKAIRFDTELNDTEGRYVSNEIFLSPVLSATGEVTEVFGIGHEITEKRAAERIVREQAGRLKAIFENSANMMIWTIDESYRITSQNEHFQHSIEDMFGFTFNVGEKFLDKMLGLVDKAEHKRIKAHYKEALNGSPQQFETALRTPDGSEIWVENFLNPISQEGRITEISCLAYGVTDKKEAEHQLRENLHEKEVLLKEVHHRVKNNLQVISSILNLQSSYVGQDQRMLDLLRESQDRIRSMSFIHESLYQSKNFSSVDLADYVERLSRNLIMSYSVNGKVSLETDLENAQLALDQAIPCGLILNELISNALKHGYPDKQEGVIHIGLHADDQRIRIEVRDDGVGLPDEFDAERDANLGLQLVHTLVEQLDATLQTTSGPGVGYFLTFDRIN